MHLRAISQEVLRSLICNTNQNITRLKLLSSLPGVNDLMRYSLVKLYGDKDTSQQWLR